MPNSLRAGQPMVRSYLYDYDEAAALVGLAPTSIRDYCFRGTYGLQRGRDFIKVRYKHGRMLRQGIRLPSRGSSDCCSGIPEA